MADEEPEVVVLEVEEEPFPPFELTEHRLLDLEYDGEPETAGLDYPAPGEVVPDDVPVAPV